MRAAEMEFEGVADPQEQETKIAAASAFHERRETPDADASMQMGTSKDGSGRDGRLQNLSCPGRWHASPKARK
jgi:hypothetical protein